MRKTICVGAVILMKKCLISVVILLCIWMLSTACAAGLLWTCPNCGKTDNTGKYCGDCGQEAPERVFYLNEYLILDHGRVTVSWTDTENRQPYTVAYRYVDDSAPQDLILGADDLTSNWFTIENLIPGKTYLVVVFDADDQMIYESYVLPEVEEFTDGELTASSVEGWVEPICKGSSDEWADAAHLSELKASEIISSRGTYEYGFEYNIRHGVLPNPREYFTQCMIYAPNGYVISTIGSDVEYGADQSDGQKFIRPSLFDRVYDRTGEIPAGTWTFELYWNGMFVNRSTFTLQ